MASATPVQICNTLQTAGACDDPVCPFSHDLFTCNVCRMSWDNQKQYDKHLKEKRHLNRSRGAGGKFWCPVCSALILGVSTWDIHVGGKRHCQRAAAKGLQGADVEPEEPPLPDNHIHCHVCDYDVHSGNWNKHILQFYHKRREEFVKIKSVLDDAAKDRNGVAISHIEGGVDMGVVEIVEASASIKAEIIIQLTDPMAKIKLLSAKLASPSSASKSFSLSNTGSITAVLRSRVETRLSIVFRQSLLGHYDDRLEISFEDTVLKQRFIIVRQVKAIVGSRQEYELLKPRAPYVPRMRARRVAESEVVPGIPPPALSTVKWVVKLPQAPIPSNLAALLSTNSVEDMLSQLRRTVLPSVLNSGTYGRHWKNVIWVEEHRMEHDLQIYDIEDAELKRYGKYYYLDVPGLAEKRPSVLTGDRILVHPHGTQDGKWYEGHVHVVRQAEVGLCFHGSFPPPRPQTRHHVHFKLQRIPLRRQHQALDTAFAAERLLFPAEQHIKPAKQIAPRLKPFNTLISGNEPQLAAVKAIVNLPPGSMPFILFGPPGTGKTITAVEAIRQVLTHNPSARILACAPSNSAADLLASRLKMLGEGTIFRFYAPSRAKDTVPSELLGYTYVNPEGNFALPPLPVLKRYRIIVCTCVSASFGHNIGIPRGHFSHIFVDEAGQATEPEVMIAVKTMADLQTNVILAGDPKQLGPIIRSTVARRLGLDVSYLQRLMQDPMYNEHAGRGVTVMKLTKNYRSHDAILKFPNERFYGGELVPCADNIVMNACIGSSTLINKKFPVIFHAMSGKDDREASSPSFFNVLEVQQVKAYIEKLRVDRQLKISTKDIGVIAPYHAQCQKIRKILVSIGAEDVKVGSVEEFQGQERRVIIISTVRSSRDFVEYDLKHTLGFVANPRRFNVAVTRAQSLLLVVGDPNVLSLDPLWRSFLNYISLRGGWTGIPIPWDPREAVREEGGYDAEARQRGAADMNMLADMIQGMALNGVVDEVDEADINIDRPWREVE